MSIFKEVRGSGSGGGAHTHPAAQISDFGEAVDDRVAALLQAGSNITLTYDDGAGTLTVAAGGGGLFTGVADHAADYTADGDDDKTLLNLTGSADITLPDVSTLPVGWTIGISNSTAGQRTVYASAPDTISGYSGIRLEAGEGCIITRSAAGFIALCTVAPDGIGTTGYGYIAGGDTGSTPSAAIERFAFAASSNGALVGDLTVGRTYPAGCSHSAGGYGYVCGGGHISTYHDVIDRFAYTASGNAADVGDLTVARGLPAGLSDQSAYGYVAAGRNALDSNVIDRFMFASSGGAADVGDVTVARWAVGAHSDPANGYGYVSGGSNNGATVFNVIDRFAMVSSANAADVGDVTAGRNGISGHSDTGNGFGYCTGGGSSSGDHNTIERFSFSASANAVDVGDLTVARRDANGHSDVSNGHGYASSGWVGSGVVSVIDRFAFAATGNAADVGDVVVNRSGVGLEG